MARKAFLGLTEFSGPGRSSRADCRGARMLLIACAAAEIGVRPVGQLGAPETRYDRGMRGSAKLACGDFKGEAMRWYTSWAAVSAAVALTACGSTKTTTVTKTKTVTVETAPTATTDNSASKPYSEVGELAKSGGIRLRVTAVRSAPAVMYESGTASQITPNATARTVKATQGGRYYFVKTRLKNETSAGIDLTCSLPVQAQLGDEDNRTFDPIDGLAQIAGNPECNANVQPGFSTTMTWVFLVPKGAFIKAFVFADMTDPSADEDFAAVRVPNR